MRTRPPKKASGKGTTTPTKTTTDVPTPTKVSKGERKRGGRGKGRKPAKLPFAKVTQEETVDVSNLATPAASTTSRGQQVPLTATASMPVPSPPTVLDKMEENVPEEKNEEQKATADSIVVEEDKKPSPLPIPEEQNTTEDSIVEEDKKPSPLPIPEEQQNATADSIVEEDKKPPAVKRKAADTVEELSTATTDVTAPSKKKQKATSIEDNDKTKPPSKPVLVNNSFGKQLRIDADESEDSSSDDEESDDSSQSSSKGPKIESEEEEAESNAESKDSSNKSEEADDEDVEGNAESTVSGSESDKESEDDASPGNGNSKEEAIEINDDDGLDSRDPEVEVTHAIPLSVDTSGHIGAIFNKTKHMIPTLAGRDFHSDYMECSEWEKQTDLTKIFYSKWPQLYNYKFTPSDQAKSRYNSFFKYINEGKELTERQRKAVICKTGATSVTLQCVLSLAPSEYLNDLVIENSMRYISAQHRDETNAYFDTRFFQHIWTKDDKGNNNCYNYEHARSYSMLRLRGLSPKKFLMLMFPLHYDVNHWQLIVVCPQKKQIVNLCSLHKQSEPHRETVFRWLYDHTKYNHPKDVNSLFNPFEKDYGWTFFNDTRVPKQPDGYNCGVFVIGYIRSLVLRSNPQYLQEHQLVEYRKTIFGFLTPTELMDKLKDKKPRYLFQTYASAPWESSEFFNKLKTNGLPKLAPLTDKDRGGRSLPSVRARLTPEQIKQEQIRRRKERERVQEINKKAQKELRKLSAARRAEKEKKEQEMEQLRQKERKEKENLRKIANKKVTKLLLANPQLKKNLETRWKRTTEITDTKTNMTFYNRVDKAFPDTDGMKNIECANRATARKNDKKVYKRHEDQVAYIKFHKGYGGQDPPRDAVNLFKESGGKIKYQYNYFLGKSGSQQIFKEQLHPDWVEDIFELQFTELVRRYPGVWFWVPIGLSKKVIPPPTTVTVVANKYQQKDNDFCIAYSVASTLHYLGHFEAATKVSQLAEKWSKIPGDLVYIEIRAILKVITPITGECEVFNKKRQKRGKGKRKKLMTLEDLTVPTPYLTVVHPIGSDGSSDHAVCLVDDLIFDARLTTALKLTEESLHWICGEQGMERVGWVFRFSQPFGIRKGQSKMREINYNW